MLAFRFARVPATAAILFAVILALSAVITSVAHPQTASAQGYPPYCAAGYVSNGYTCVYSGGGYCPYPGYQGCTTGYGTCTYGTTGCVNGVCTSGSVSNGYGGCTYPGGVSGACGYGTAGCVNGICASGYYSNGAGGCTYSGGAYGTCTYGTAGCVNGICTSGYVSNGVGGCTYGGGAYGTCVYGTTGCVNGVCTSGYVSNGASGCTYSGGAYGGTCVYGTTGCVNGVCTSGYISNGASGCTYAGAGAAVGGTVTALSTGCDLVVVAFGAGATPQQVVTATANPSAVLSVWGWDNAGQRWMGFFPNQAGAPSDLLTLAARAAVFVCVNSPTTLSAP